jgi:SAM-dependent methyltransferase
MIVLVEGHANAVEFLSSGALIAETIRELLAVQGAPVESLASILDFGCGCGRVLRHWRDISDRIAVHGSDYNRKLLDWCRTHLPFARFMANELSPPLPYADGAFDLVYAISVFTHLPQELQLAWIDELARVTAPGGHVLVTLHGEAFRRVLNDAEKAEFDRGELVVRYPEGSCSNLCAAFHPEDYVRRLFARGLRIADYQPGRLTQDVVLLRKCS